MSRLNIGVNAVLLNGDREVIFGVDITVGVGMGPNTLTLRPAAGAEPMSLEQIVKALAKLLGINALDDVASLGDSPIWGKIFKLAILPELTVVLAEKANSIQAVFKLYFPNPVTHKLEYGITVSDFLPSYLTIEPDLTIFDLIVGYFEKDGLALKARILVPPQESLNTKSDGTALLKQIEPSNKTEIVDYPFPEPGQGSQTFRVNFLGLGQRFGPPVEFDAEDPIKEIFSKLENNLRSNDPATILKTLVNQYYHPDRNWFFGADIYVKGWRVQLIFNDPVIYGIRITCDTNQFKGFLFEILYQKLGPDLGVYYGALTVPTKYRTINLGAVALTLPSFKIWIYTNGDFKVSVGWPLGAESIGFEIYIFIGKCAFYIAKLRSGLNPRAKDYTIYYQPIIAFGLAINVGLGRSINKGVFQAELSLTVLGVFQGILAWEGEPPKQANAVALQQDTNLLRSQAVASSISGPPDYYWFSATVGVIGILQGSVDLKIIKVTIAIRLSITASLAFEKEYGSILQVTASVSVEARIKIVFVTIKASFSITITETFDLSKGPNGRASVDGPQNPNFQGIVPTLERESAELSYPAKQIIQDANSDAVKISMVLMPAAVYTSGVGQSNAVAVPFTAPPNGDSGGTDTGYDVLLIRLAKWLLREFAPTERSWQAVVIKLGQGREEAPAHFEQLLDSFLANEIVFTLLGVDLSSDSEDEELLPLPMFPCLQMKVTGQSDPIVFDSVKTPANYDNTVRNYFDNLSLSSLSSNPPKDTSNVFGPTANTGPSIARMLFTDFFLMLSRDLANRLVQDETTSGRIADDLEAHVRAVAVQVASMSSQNMFGGILLPDPSVPVSSKTDLESIALKGVYVLSSQQFAVDQSTSINSAEFSIADATSPLAAAIKFYANKANISSRIPVAAPPKAPNPIWSDTTLALAVANINIRPLPSVESSRRWIATRQHETWNDLSEALRLLFPTEELLSLTASGPLTLFAQSKAPTEVSVPTGELSVVPGLFIQFRARQVTDLAGGVIPENTNNRDVMLEDGNNDNKDPVTSNALKNVYEISTTDDETRNRIGILLNSPELQNVMLSLLVEAVNDKKEKGGYDSLPTAASENQAFLFKTNLSTLTQPETLVKPFLSASVDTGSVSNATFDDAGNLLRLLWEASVVNAAGFYLYYEDEKGEGLPKRLFESDDSVIISILAQPRAASPLRNYHNALAVPEVAKDTVYIAADHEDGTAVMAHQSAYQPGCVGFEIDWEDAMSQTLALQDRPPPYGEDTIAALYDMIQFRVDNTVSQQFPFKESLWSLPLSRAKEKSVAPENNANADTGAGTYRQIVPVYRFQGAGNEGIYAATGGNPTLSFRLLDSYGDALVDATHQAAFKVEYHDPLISIGEWPGTRAGYRVEKNGDHNQSVINVMLDFQPDEIVRKDIHAFLQVSGVTNADAEDKAKQQAEIASYRYGFILAQLQDANVKANLLTTLFGDDAPLNKDATFKAQLVTYVESVQAQLKAFIADSTPLTVSTATISLPIAAKQLLDQSSNLFSISVSLELLRTAHVDPLAEEKLPASKRVFSALPPDINYTKSPDINLKKNPSNSGTDTNEQDVNLRRFATDFEAVFKGFDGADGYLKLATKTGVSDFAAASEGPTLWGVRWSKTAGINVEYIADQVAYFSLLPISTTLQDEQIDVVVYNNLLEGKTEKRSFTSIDVDVWAKQFLVIMDSILGPESASNIVKQFPDLFDKLIQSKSLLAQCIRYSVGPVFVNDADHSDNVLFGPHKVVEGDLESARDRFEQSVLRTLASAYDNAVLMQAPALVTNTNAGQYTDANAPRLFGGISVGKPNKAFNSSLDSAKKDVLSVSSARLITTPTRTSEPRFANMLVNVSNPGVKAYFDVDLSWQASFIEHQISPENTYDGYIPSTWLRFIETELESKSLYDLGSYRVPLPSISYPSNPVLELQTAQQEHSADGLTPGVTQGLAENKSVNESVKALFNWTYSVTLNKTERNATDTMYTELRLNEAIERSSLFKSDSEEKGNLTPFFKSMAQFQVAWPVLEPQLSVLTKEASNVLDNVENALTLFESLVHEVARSWAIYRGVPLPAGFRAPVKFDALADVPKEELFAYAISFEQAYGESPALIVSSEQNEVWPLINTVKGTQTTPRGKNTYSRIYNFKAISEKLVLEWLHFDALSQQTGRLSSWIVRNANISGDENLKTNPKLVYRTNPTTFTNPAIPLIRLKNFGEPIPFQDTLAETLSVALEPLLGVGSAAAEERVVKIETRFEIDLLIDKRSSSAKLKSSVAVLLSDDIEVASSSSIKNDTTTLAHAVTPTQIAEQIAEDLDIWFTANKPITNSSYIVQSFTLFAHLQNQQLPLLTLDRIVYSVKPGWWKLP